MIFHSIFFFKPFVGLVLQNRKTSDSFRRFLFSRYLRRVSGKLPPGKFLPIKLPPGEFPPRKIPNQKIPIFFILVTFIIDIS